MSHLFPSHPLPPLPPPAEEVETVKVFKQLSRTSRALGELKGIANTIPNQAMLINAIALREAKDSSEIENIVTSHDELYKAMSAEANVNPETKEVMNYRKAIFRGFDMIRQQEFLRLADIVELQKLLVENEAGIRSTPGTVLRNDQTGKVVYVPPQHPDEIMDLLTNFLEHFNVNPTRSEPLIHLAVLHYQFESIHPFYDGNGRTGRILNILFLILNNLIDIPILYLSSYIIEHKSEYYRLLQGINERNEWEPWILYLLRAVEETSLRTINKVLEIGAALEVTIAEVAAQASKIYRKELVELLYEHPYSKVEYVVDRLGVERKAASRYLKELETIGVLERIKVGRENLFINKRLIAILKKP